MAGIGGNVAHNAIKSISLGTFDRFMDWLVGDTQGEPTQTAIYQRVGAVNRGVNIRAQAVAGVPFSIYRGDEQVDSSDAWQNTIKIMPNPRRLFQLIEQALCIWGAAYLSRYVEEPLAPGLRYLATPTIEFDGISQDGRSALFTRTTNNGNTSLTQRDLVIFWAPDAMVEYGPPSTSPVRAALAAGGILMSIDQFAAKYAAGGLVKMTILGVPQGTQPDERERIEGIFNKLFTGVANAFRVKAINADAVKPTVIGGGLDEFGNGELLQGFGEQVATALGVPQTLLFANAANYATASQDAETFYQNTIVPECDFIASVLNVQVLDQMGYQLRFNSNSLDVFQENETERSSAYKTYIDAGMKPSIAAQMLGLDMPLGVEYADLDPQPAPAPTPAPQQPEPSDPGMMDDLKAWRRKSLKRGRLADFESATITPTVKALVASRVESMGLEQGFSFLKSWEDSRADNETAINEAIQPVFDDFADDSITAIEKKEEPDYSKLAAALLAALMPQLSEIASEAAMNIAAETGIEMDPASVSAMASNWAQSYGYDLVAGLTDTTRASLQKTLSQYIANPSMDMEQLKRLLEPTFGKIRADMIASTETTRAFSAAMDLYRGMLEKSYPGLKISEEWLTHRDERVCPICGALDGQPRAVWEQQFPGGPPAHPRCRCAKRIIIVGKRGTRVEV